MLLDHLGSSILDLIFISEKGGVSWVEFVRGYNKCCARMSASMSLNILLRVFAVTLQKAGSPSNLEFESDDVECKITGSLKPVDVLMLLWMCWAISWNSRTSKISKEKIDLPLPDINQIVLSAIVSCADVGSGLNVWDCQLSGLEVELPVGKFLSWVVRTVPSLPDCFSQFVYAILKNCVSHKDGLECSTSSVVENASTMAYSSHLLSSGMAWAISLALRGTISEEISKACFPSETDGIDKNLLYRSSLHGRGLNRFWSNIEGYQGPLLMLFSATSGDASDGRANERKWTVGALTNQGFENKDLFYGSSGNLYAISPVFHVYPPTGKEKNFVYSHLHPTGRAYEPKPKPVGIGFGGSLGNERIFIDEDFSKVTIRHHAADKTYQPGSLFPDQGFLPVEALISEVEVWGLGGRSAKDVQDSYKKREQLFTDQRRKVDLKTFANWEDSPEKMMMDMVSDPNAVQREDR
ncbi:PREDICTED: TLD [Prunus dulcis]|nr:PREDICTED: TLD [Prunus dulcis]